MTLTHRPCGACGVLVTPLGCKHWRPEHEVNETESRVRRRESQRQARMAQRQKAKRDLDEFRRQMGIQT